MSVHETKPDLWNIINGLKAEIARLTAELDTATKYAEAYFDESELLKKQVAKLRALVVHAAACNPEATGENAAIALRQIVKHARAALEETK